MHICMFVCLLAYIMYYITNFNKPTLFVVQINNGTYMEVYYSMNLLYCK